MMTWKNKDTLVLVLILLLGAVLRFWGYAQWSLSNDELSAVTRLDFGSVGEVITQGVRPDFHPAGVEVFLYCWTGIFGNDVWAVRLPFVLCGIASVYYCYRISKRWFNVNVAQLAALTLACLSYPVLYSELARPYSPGLLFSLALVHHWTRYFFDGSTGWKTCVAIAFCMAACMYTHYFAFFFAVMVGATGLLFIRRENYRPYLLASASAVLFFLPHLGITLDQFSRGGVGSWLGKPDTDYLRGYLYYAFNESAIFLIAFTGLFIFSIISNAGNIRPNRFRVIALAWFIIPYLFGYYYSVYRNPILQYSVLLFSFPFLVMYVHSYYCEKRTPFRYVLLTLLAAGILLSAVKEQDFFHVKPFSEFRGLTEKKLEWDRKANKNIPTVFNVIAPAYPDYYFKKEERQPKWEWLRGDDSLFTLKFMRIIDTYTGDLFIYGWSNSAEPFEVYEIIKKKYPRVVEDHVYFNSRITLFSKASGAFKRPALADARPWGKQATPGWNFDRTKIDTFWLHVNGGGRDSVPGGYSYRVSGNAEYSPGFSAQFKDLTPDSMEYINLSAVVSSREPVDLELVMEMRDALTDSLYEWRSEKIKDTYSPYQGAYSFLLTKKVPERQRPNDKLRVYLWNHSKTGYIIEDMSITSYKDMDYAPVQNVKELIELLHPHEKKKKPDPHEGVSTD